MATSRFAALLVAALVLAPCAAARANESTLTLRLHEQTINRLASAALPHSETRRYRGEVDLGVTRRHWEVTVRYTVLAVETQVKPDHVAFNAQVRVQGEGMDYTSIARGRLDVGVAGGKLVLTASRLTLPLSVAPLGVRIDLGEVAADDFLPAEWRRTEIDLAALAMPVALPGQRQATVRLTSARTELATPFVLVHADVGL